MGHALPLTTPTSYAAHAAILERLVPTARLQEPLAHSLLYALDALAQRAVPLVLDDAHLLLEVFRQPLLLLLAQRIRPLAALLVLHHLGLRVRRRLLDLVQQAEQVGLRLDELVRALLGVQHKAEEVLQRVLVIRRVLLVLLRRNLHPEASSAEVSRHLVEQPAEWGRNVPERRQLHLDAAHDVLLHDVLKRPRPLEDLVGKGQLSLRRILGEEGLGGPYLFLVIRKPLWLVVALLLRHVRCAFHVVKQPTGESVEERVRLGDAASEELVQRDHDVALEMFKVGLFQVLESLSFALVRILLNRRSLCKGHVARVDFLLKVAAQSRSSLRSSFGSLFPLLAARLLPCASP
ncbi:hypothetical protein HYQ46_001991 [Verticillium longisporum]|nr:hypothetical protein HYQ46_001991 [Verticillium longisporum]